MAQVYQFVDDNGVTRLLAEIVPDPTGTPFNGGTITDGLEIDPPSGTEALKIVSVDGDGTKLIDAAGVHTIFTVDSDGGAVLSSDDRMTLAVIGTGGTSASISASDATNSVVLDTSTSSAWSYGGSTVALIDANGINVHLHAAPADGALAAGDCCLWFDQTDGAGKLMIKAKTANGTVATGSVSLT